MKRTNLIFLVVTLITSVMFIGSGCGKKGSSSPIRTITGTITIPSGISGNFSALSSISRTTVQAGSPFSISVLGKYPAIITINNDKGNPVLLNVTNSGNTITIDASSTAVSLIYLSPGIAQNNFKDEQQVMDLIKGLPQTQALTNLLEKKLQLNSNILSTVPLDPDIVAGVNQAVDALINKIKSSGQVQTAGLLKTLAVNPANASGLYLSFDSNSKTLTAKNKVMRYVAIYVGNDPNPLISMSHFSPYSCAVHSFLQDIEGVLGMNSNNTNCEVDETANVSDFDGSPLIVKAYGAGIANWDTAWENATTTDKERWIAPTARTMLEDIIDPIVSTAVGKDINFCAQAEIISIIQDTLNNYSTQIQNAYQTQGATGAMNVITQALVNVMYANNGEYYMQIFNDCVVDQYTISSQVKSIFSDMINALLGPIKTIVIAPDVVSSSLTMLLSQPIENFLLTSDHPTVQPPSVPTNLTAAAGDRQVTLSWQQVADAGSYIVYISSVSGGPYQIYNTPITPPVTVVLLTNGSTYYFVVQAMNSAGVTSGYSNEASATPHSTISIPYAPTNFVAIPGNDTATLSWNASSGATGYKIYYSLTSGGPYTKIGFTSTTGYTTTGLTNGITYYFVVTAVNSAGESGYSNQASATPSASLQPPTAPTNLTATAGNGQVSLSWSASSGATGYNVYDSTTSGGPYTKVGTTSNTSYTVTGLTNGVTYYFVVTAVNTNGESSASAQVSAAPATTVDITGTWSGSWASSNGINNGNISAVLTQSGTSVIGTLSITGSPCISNGSVSGTVSGNNVSFGIISGSDTVEYNATYTSTSMSGTYSVTTGACAGDTGTFSLSVGG